MTTLGADLVAMVCAHCDHPTTLSLLSTCRALRPDDGTFRLIAEVQWGREFWGEALGRPTHRTFVSMRDELAQIERMRRFLASKGEPMWTIDKFRVLWACEAMLCENIKDDPQRCRSLIC